MINAIKLIILIFVAGVTINAQLYAMNETEVKSKIQTILDKSVSRGINVQMGLLLVHSDKHNLHWSLETGEKRSESEQFHTASIGKTFTSVVISQLVEEGRLSFEDKISTYLQDDLLANLFVYKGVDYQGQIEVRHLLSHSSGLGDWFEDKPVEGDALLTTGLNNPEKIFRPNDALAYSQNQIRAKSAPEKSFHYSDTGYLLLGKIIEAVTDTTFEANLQSRIFKPLDMADTYLYTSEIRGDAERVAFLPVWMKDKEVTGHGWICADWSGGGVVSTREDLLKFMQGLVHYQLVSEKTFTQWKDYQKFGYGMRYGYGILQLDLHKFTFGYPEYLDVWGNWGSISSFMFYNQEHDLYLIGTFNQSRHIRKVVPFLMKTLKTMDQAI